MEFRNQALKNLPAYSNCGILNQAARIQSSLGGTHLNYLYKKKVVTIQAPDPRKKRKKGETVNTKQQECTKEQFLQGLCKMYNLEHNLF